MAPQAPPVLEVSKSTRKPRPTKLQKLLAQYGVEEIDELPEKEKQKALSLKRKQQNAEAVAAVQAAAAAASVNSATVPPQAPPFGDGVNPMFGHKSQHSSATPPGNSHGQAGHAQDRRQSGAKGDPMDIDSGPTLHPGLFMSNGAAGPQIVSDNSTLSLEERLLSGDEVNFRDPHERSKALEILGRTEFGRKRAEEMFGPGIWNDVPGMRRPSSGAGPGQHDERAVDKMFDDLTNSGDDKSRETFEGFVPTAESLESERNGMDALLDGE